MLKAILIDDEAESVHVLSSLLNEYCKDVEVVAHTTSPAEAIQLIREKKPDVLFLDIDMPGLSGFDLLKTIPERNFEVVFVTAHNDRAIEAFRVSATDYLLKPVSVVELVAAVEKVSRNLQMASGNNDKIDHILREYEALTGRKVGFATNEGVIYLCLSDIIRLKAETSYSHIYLTGNKQLFVSKNLSEAEDMIRDKNFFRVHRSHLVNIRHVIKFHSRDGGYVEMSDGAKVEVSRRKKEEFIEFLAQAIL